MNHYKNTQSHYKLTKQAKKDRNQALAALIILLLGTILTGLQF